MNLLMSSIINEWVKLWSRKKTVFFLSLMLVLPFLGLPIIMNVQSGLGITAVVSADYPITVLNVLLLFVLPLLIFMSAADMFSGEFGDRTIRAVLVRPVSRFKLFAAKLLAAFALIGASLLAAWVSSVAAAFFLPGSGGMAIGIAESALAYMVAAIPMFALCTVAVFIAQLFKNASGALAICLLIYAAAKLLAFVFPAYMAFSPTAYANWHEIWIGSSISLSKIVTIFSYLLGCGIVFSTFGYYAFDKKEV